jgi:hypothetical protein
VESARQPASAYLRDDVPRHGVRRRSLRLTGSTNCADSKAVRRDLPDLCMFLMGTRSRIGEALAVLWGQVNFDAGEIEITHTIIRVRGEGLLRKPTKSRAGERVLKLPLSVVAMPRSRFMAGRACVPGHVGRVPRPVEHAAGASRCPWGRSLGLGDVTQFPQDCGDCAGPQWPQRTPGGRPAWAFAAVDDEGRLPRPQGRQPSRRRCAG